MGCCSSKGGGDGGGYIDYSMGNEKDFMERFLEDRELGQGEFGIVKLVYDTTKKSNDDAVGLACKTLRKGFVFKDNTMYTPLKAEVIQAECDILKTLAGKEYCLNLIGIWETPSTLYMVTELCEGGEMMQYIAQQKEELRTEDVSRIAFQLLSAIHHCSQHQIIHRDIKPENIMFQTTLPKAELRLIDFGSGTIKRQQEQDKEQEEAPGGDDDFHTTFCGTAFYTSPELFQRHYNDKTDVWSVGITLYVLVAGYPAQLLQRAFNLIQKSQERGGRDYRKAPGMPSDVPDAYIDLLNECTRYNPEERKSAGQLLLHEYCQFHIQHQKDEQEEEHDKLMPMPSSGRVRRTQSFALLGSSQRHGTFLNYQQFERSLTTLLATLLKPNDLNVFMDRLANFEHDGSDDDTEDEDLLLTPSMSPVNQNIPSSTKSAATTKGQVLDAVPIKHVKKLLAEMRQNHVLNAMESKLNNASQYEDFSYHYSFLRPFCQNNDYSQKKGTRELQSPRPGTANPLPRHASSLAINKSSRRFSQRRGSGSGDRRSSLFSSSPFDRQGSGSGDRRSSLFSTPSSKPMRKSLSSGAL